MRSGPRDQKQDAIYLEKKQKNRVCVCVSVGVCGRTKGNTHCQIQLETPFTRILMYKVKKKRNRIESLDPFQCFNEFFCT